MVTISERLHSTRDRVIRGTLSLAFIGGTFLLGFVLLGTVGILGWEYSNSEAFCTDTCHDVHPEEPVAYQDSYHARVKCTECHMGRVSMLEGMLLKSSHFRHLPEVVFGLYERPLESETMRPASESCERCHWPPAFHDDRARQVERFLPDRANSLENTYLLLKTGVGAREQGQGYGIHWHISNPVEYIATDAHKQDIRWVRVTRPDGRIVEYNDALNPLSLEEIAQADKRTMDCVDCHNRVGHPFPSPEELLDRALAEGRLSQALPYAKKEMLALLTADYPGQDEALAAAESLRARYGEVYPEIAAVYAPEIEQAVQLARKLVSRLVFEEPGVDWQSFPDNSGHKDFAGCFRCHDGKHWSPEGEAIQLQCTLCHSVPLTMAASEEPPAMPVASRRKPPSHMDTLFVSSHRFQADSTCAECHGEIRFGRDDSSFCANSACHARDWQMVDLDAIFTHPIPLEGKHATANCHACHNQSAEMTYDCSGCHEPPVQPHYGSACQDCHTPGSFALALASRSDHPVPLEGRHASLDCASCHARGESLRNECAACHQPPENHLAGTCDSCHSPFGWVGATAYVGGGLPVPHAVTPGENCLLCHDPAGQNDPAPPDHAAYANEQCTLCHVPGTSTLASIGQAPHPLGGQHASVACELCHAGGTIEVTLQECVACHQQDDAHAAQLGQDCAQCHSADGWRKTSFDHALTAFSLLGKHKAADCHDCHVNNVYKGTSQACVACHQQDDAHAGQFGQNCAQCHSSAGWGSASFDHALTAFPLSGRHTGTDCAQCHPNNVYKGTPQTCIACHQQDDAHARQFGQNCAQCHSPAGWGGASFDHALTAFPLSGAHAGTACAQCHPNNVYKGTPQACVACHQQDDAHAGQFGQNCAQCHSPAGWGGASFDHALTAFPLTGAHVNTACAQCHPNGVYQGTPSTCVSCHGEPAFHAGLFGTDCTTCHTTQGWLPAGYDRPHTFPIGHGGHGSNSCRTCHGDTLAAYSCFTCHAHDPSEIESEHREEGITNYQDCVGCHPTGRED